MKEKIQEVQNYFADKLARGLYKVTDADELCLKVIVDGKYIFGIWLSNGWDNFGLWSNNFISVEFTEEQQKTGWKIGDRWRKKLWVDKSREKDLTELKRLQKKYPDTT